MLATNACRTCKYYYERYQPWIYPMLASYVARSRGTTGGVIADVGVGPGHLSAELVEGLAPDRLLALDINPAMLELADELFRARGVADRVELVEGDVHALPWDDGSIDLIVSYGCLHHWADPERGLADCGRVLAPGGLLLLIDTTPVSDATLAAFADVVQDPDCPDIVNKAYAESIAPDAALALAEAAGLADVTVEPLAFDGADLMAALDVLDELAEPPAGLDTDEPTCWTLTYRKPLENAS